MVVVAGKVVVTVVVVKVIFVVGFVAVKGDEDKDLPNKGETKKKSYNKNKS